MKGLLGCIEVRKFCLVKHFIAVEILNQRYFVIDVAQVHREELFPISSKRLQTMPVPEENR